MVRSKFYSDKTKEEAFSQWLDEHFYNNFPYKITKIKRALDKTVQAKGIDIGIRANGELFLIDEKASLHYVNKNIPTFAFELLNRTSGKIGWLFNVEYETTHYLLAWPNATTNYPKAKNDFTSAEVMLIKRADLINYLNSIGINETTAKNYVNQYLPLVNNDNYKFEIKPGILLFFTEYLHEKPVNLVIRKEILSKIALFYKKI